MSTSRHDTSATPDRRGTLVAPFGPKEPRLILAPEHAGQRVLDGGWWPRSWDPAAELGGLVVALSDRFGPIRQILLSSVWERRFRRLAVGGIMVRMGWFASMDPALLVAITDHGDQIDLLVVAPDISQEAAERAMRTAAAPGNLTRAPHILTATSTMPVPSVNGSAAKAVWDNEGRRRRR